MGAGRQKDRRQKDRGQPDRRGEPRFETSMWVGIPDVDGEPELEKCNISASGMLLRTPRDAGAPGAVRMLRLVTADLGTEIDIMAHVVRVFATEDAELGRVIEATAFEFLPHQPRELEGFLREALEAELTVAPGIKDLPRKAQPASVSAPSVSGVVIHTNRAVEVDTKVHLSGALSEVALPSLLGFFELERASGVLRLERDSKTAALFVREGRILDVESEPVAPSATEALASLLEWPDGAFEFKFQSVERADAIGKSTTALLMECAQRSDESSR